MSLSKSCLKTEGNIDAETDSLSSIYIIKYCIIHDLILTNLVFYLGLNWILKIGQQH